MTTVTAIISLNSVESTHRDKLSLETDKITETKRETNQIAGLIRQFTVGKESRLVHVGPHSLDLDSLIQLPDGGHDSSILSLSDSISHVTCWMTSDGIGIKTLLEVSGVLIRDMNQDSLNYVFPRQRVPGFGLALVHSGEISDDLAHIPRRSQEPGRCFHENCINGSFTEK